MVELRAEDVKEALDAFEVASPENMDGTRGVFVAAPSLDQMVAVIEAAHAWLASQEQTPDERRCEHGLIGAHHIAHYGCDGNGCGQQCPGGAALVGFHPQPEGDER